MICERYGVRLDADRASVAVTRKSTDAVTTIPKLTEKLALGVDRWFIGRQKGLRARGRAP